MPPGEPDQRRRLAQRQPDRDRGQDRHVEVLQRTCAVGPAAAVGVPLRLGMPVRSLAGRVPVLLRGALLDVLFGVHQRRDHERQHRDCGEGGTEALRHAEEQVRTFPRAYGSRLATGFERPAHWSAINAPGFVAQREARPDALRSRRAAEQPAAAGATGVPAERLDPPPNCRPARELHSAAAEDGPCAIAAHWPAVAARRPRRLRCAPLPTHAQTAGRTARSLRTSLTEGMVAEVVSACSSGAVLTAWALHLGLPEGMVAALAALPACAQLVQLPAAQLTSRGGARKVAIWSVSLSRQILLPLALLPLLGLNVAVQRGLLVGVAVAAAVLGVVGNNAWTAWMAELVPARIRGRYFGRRAAACTLGSTLASVSVGLALDVGRRAAATGVALAVLSLVACLAGAVTTALLLRQHEPARFRPRPLPTVAALKSCLAQGPRRVLAYQLIWGAAGGIAAGFYNLHAITHLHLGFMGLALYNGGIAAARMVTATFWGKAVDRAGARPVLIVCSAGLALPPLLWAFLTPDRLWPLFFDASLCGALMAGQSLASFALPLTLAPRDERPFHLAAFCTAGGVATAAAAVAGGLFLKWLPADWTLFGSLRMACHALFFASAAARLGAAFVGARILEPGALPVSSLLARPRWSRSREDELRSDALALAGSRDR